MAAQSGRGAYLIEVAERVMLSCIQATRSVWREVAALRYGFHEASPGDVCCTEFTSEICSVQITARTVRSDVESRSRDEGQVVRKRGMSDCVVLRGIRPGLGESAKRSNGHGVIE